MRALPTNDSRFGDGRNSGCMLLDCDSYGCHSSGVDCNAKVEENQSKQVSIRYITICIHGEFDKFALSAVPPSCSPIFQYKFSHFSVSCMLFYKNFSIFSKFYQYLCSEFSKNTGKSVYLEAMLMTLSICNISHIHVNENTAYVKYLTILAMHEGMTLVVLE